MILSVIFIAIVGVVAFFHFTQGFFSAFISVVLTLVATAVALGLHEQVVFALGGKTGDFVTSLSICGLFGLTYFILRVIFDSFIKGNVNFGSTPDKVGATLMGIIAGLLTSGVVAIAANAMPFQGVMAGYSPWAAEKVQVSLSTIYPWTRYGRNESFSDRLYMYDWMQEPNASDEKASSMILPVDKFALGFISMVSAGSLEGAIKWSDRHPNYTLELARQRFGLQPGAKKVAFPTKGKPIDVAGVFRGPQSYKQIDSDIVEYRVSTPAPSATLGTENGALLVVRVIFGGETAEKDGKVRFALTSFRLVAGAEGKKRNYVPVATLYKGETAVADRPDNFLVVDSGKGVDLIFDVDPEILSGDGAEAKLAAGSFLEFKRYGWADLAGMEVKPAGAINADERTATAVYRRQGWVGHPPRTP